MPPELLLTGGTGFVGYYLSHQLAASGRRFTALVREDSDTTYLEELGDRCRLVVGDLNDPESLVEALRGIDTVIHAAARVSFRAGDEEALLRTNGEGTANLVNMMQQCGTRRLVHVSSVAVLNRVDGGPVVTEADRWPLERLDTAYARSKFAAEREVWRGRAEGLSVAAVYPSIVLGAGDWLGNNTPSLWRRASRGSRFYPLGASGFVDVRDVVNGILEVVDRNLDGDRFVLSAENLEWRTVLTDIARSIGVSPPSVGVPAWQSNLLWPLERLRARLTGGEALLTRESNRTAQSRYRYDGSAIERATGLRYLPVAATLREIGKAYLLASKLGKVPPAVHLPLLDVA